MAVFSHVVAVVPAAAAVAVPRHRRAAAALELEPPHLHRGAAAAAPLHVGHAAAAVDARGAGRVHPGLLDGRPRQRAWRRPPRRRVRRPHVVVAPIVGRGHVGSLLPMLAFVTRRRHLISPAVTQNYYFTTDFGH